MFYKVQFFEVKTIVYSSRRCSYVNNTLLEQYYGNNKDNNKLFDMLELQYRKLLSRGEQTLPFKIVVLGIFDRGYNKGSRFKWVFRQLSDFYHYENYIELPSCLCRGDVSIFERCKFINKSEREVNLNDYLSSYSTKNCSIGLKSRKLYLGFELEVSKGKSRLTDCEAKELVSTLSRQGFICKRDASVYGEFTSNPLVLSEASNLATKTADFLQKKGFVSWQGGACGFHVHISKSAVIDKIALLNFFLKYKKDFKLLSGRVDTHYCSFDTETIKDNFSGCGSRFSAINFLNKRTVEFRLWRGTLNKERLNMYLNLSDALGRFSQLLPNFEFRDFLFIVNDLKAITLSGYLNDSILNWAYSHTKTRSLKAYKGLLKRFNGVNLSSAYNNFVNNNY